MRGTITQRELAEEYGVSQTTISAVIRAQTWRYASPHGEQSGRSRQGRTTRVLTPEQVHEIRALEFTKEGDLAETAARYRVHPSTIYRIRAGLTYRDIAERDGAQAV